MQGRVLARQHMIMFSDGFPQDFDYGQDRRWNAYGMQDTMVALKELELAGAAVLHHGGQNRPRLLAPDVPSSRYMVIEDIASLPRQLPKIYEQVIRW